MTKSTLEDFSFKNIQSWSRNATLNDGTQVLLRAQRPTDQEPLWEMVSMLSDDTLAQLTDRFTHELIENWIKTLDYEKILPIMPLNQMAESSATLQFTFTSAKSRNTSAHSVFSSTTITRAEALDPI
ncbi:MAG: hypothetical protein NTY03_01655 [Candidatus Bathyarchaeota archaeon]|nr:hypothetical protein [Candidatus Bathyarchaeota archaeon]